MKKTEDHRVKYTKMILRQALLEILKTKPMKKITVSELCEKAKINRATFYRHYYDTYDLLESIEKELFDLIISKVANESDLLKITEDVCYVIKDNLDICDVLLGGFGNSSFIEDALNDLKDRITVDWGEMEKSTYDYTFAFIANGSIGMFRKWKERGFSDSPEEIAKIMATLTAKGLLGYEIK